MIFSAILLGRIAPYAQSIIGPYQRGFTAGKSATDQIFSAWQAIQKLLEYAAYDSIARVKLYTAMREFGIPTKWIRLTWLTLNNVRRQIKAAGSGTKFGDAILCVLFNLAFKKVFRGAEVNAIGTILSKSIQLLSYADNIDIMRRTTREVPSSRSTKHGQTGRIRIGEYNFETVDNFSYLGSKITTKSIAIS